MEVGDIEGFELGCEVGELGDWVVHFHGLERTEGGETDSGAGGADGGSDGGDDF